MRRILRTLALVVAPPLASCVPSYEFTASSDGGAADATMEGASPADGAAADAASLAHDAAEDTAVPADADMPLEDANDANEGDDAPVAPVSLTDCVLLLHMDEPSWSGAGSVKDSSGAGNDGAPVGTATTTASGKFGRAALLDGSGYVDVPDSVSLHPTNALTYVAWIYPTGLATPDAAQAYPGIVSKRTDYGINVAFTMFLWTGDNLWGDIQGPTDAERFYSDATFTNGQWYHVAVVYDGTLADATLRIRIYVNGALDSTHEADATFAPAPTPAPDLLVGYLDQGTRDPDPNGYFTGRIDEVAVWTRALSAAEIASLYAATGPL